MSLTADVVAPVRSEGFFDDALATSDPAVATAIAAEMRREKTQIELIASENIVSRAVLEAQGSVLTNKYAEGYPGKRYYQGCEPSDAVESLAIERARALFGCGFANVQPHSGAQANGAVLLATLKPGDTILGMSLDAGGHLTHGARAALSGKWFHAVQYGVRRDDHLIDFDQVRDLAREHRPKLIVCGASAYPRHIEFDKFREIADEVGAKLMADIAHPAGLVAAKLHPDPIPYCDYVTTTTHKTLRGPRGGMVMARAELMKEINSKVFPGIQGGPLMHVIAAKAVAFREALQPSFADYAGRIISNARVLAETLLAGGLDLVSGGTDNHLMLVDLTKTGQTGKAAEAALEAAGITVNKNTIPNETRSPFVTSGIRIGTPAMTTRGMGADEMRSIGGWILEVLANPESAGVTSRVRESVEALCAKFPAPGPATGRGGNR